MLHLASNTWLSCFYFYFWLDKWIRIVLQSVAKKKKTVIYSYVHSWERAWKEYWLLCRSSEPLTKLSITTSLKIPQGILDLLMLCAHFHMVIVFLGLSYFFFLLRITPSSIKYFMDLLINFGSWFWRKRKYALALK